MAMVKHGIKEIHIEKDEWNVLIKLGQKAQYERMESKYNIKIEQLIVAEELENCFNVYYFRKVADPENYPLYRQMHKEKSSAEANH